MTLPFDEGCRRERAISLACVRSDQARALVHAFFAERNVARVPGLPKDARVADIKAVAIIGAGTMGAGIAMACANAGLRVTLSDIAPEAVERGLAAIRRNYESSVTRGRLSAGTVDERLGLIHTCVGYDGCETADLIIEAVFENLALKQQIFARSIAWRGQAACWRQTLHAGYRSNRGVDQPAASVVGLHFFSPATYAPARNRSRHATADGSWRPRWRLRSARQSRSGRSQWSGVVGNG